MASGPHRCVSYANSTNPDTLIAAGMSIKQTAFFDFEDELSATRRLLERLPYDRFSWRPHDKSWTLGELATHIASLPWWMQSTLAEDGFDVAGGTPPPETRTDTASVLEFFDTTSAELRHTFEAATDETFDEAWQLRSGETVLMEQSKSAVLRRWGISHLVHHRAQLTVYLRMLDVPLPQIYGPTADES